MNSLPWINRLAYEERRSHHDAAVANAAATAQMASRVRIAMAALRAILARDIEADPDVDPATPAITCENDGSRDGFVIRGVGRNRLTLAVQLIDNRISCRYGAPAWNDRPALDQQFVVTRAVRAGIDGQAGALTLDGLSALLLQPFRSGGLHDPSRDIIACF